MRLHLGGSATPTRSGRGALRALRALLLLLELSGVRANFYSDLGLRRSASAEDVKSAYKSMAKKYHPDKNKDPNAQSRFQKIAEAYETLSDPDKRRLYDLHGSDYSRVQQQQQAQQQQQRQQDDFFHAFGGHHRRGRQQVRDVMIRRLAHALSRQAECTLSLLPHRVSVAPHLPC